MRILITDDDYTSRLKLKAMLAQSGDVDSASDGELAIMMVKKAIEEGVPYDLITMDIGLPDMRGQVVVERIRELERAHHQNPSPDASTTQPEAKIVMITGMKDPRNVMAAFTGGCEGYLVKPVTPTKFKTTLSKIGLTV